MLPQQDTSLGQGIGAFGTYEGGDVDNVDLRSGNVNIRIPLFSIPQKGKLSLSMAAFVNNGGYMRAPYCETAYDSPGYADGGSIYAQYCTYVYLRTSAIGPLVAFDQLLLDAFPIGAGSAGYFSGGTSATAAEGGVLEPSGATHQFGSENIGTNGLSGANDGSGYQKFGQRTNAGAYDANGLFYQIPGILYPQADVPPSLYAALLSQPISEGSGSISDPSGNSITYVQSIASNYFGSINNANYGLGITYVDGYGWAISTSGGTLGQQNIQHVTGYHIVDSSGNVIPSLFEETLGSTASCPVLSNRTPLAGNQPALYAIPWTVPGPNGQNVTYTICYTDVYYNTDFNQQQYGYGTPMCPACELDLPVDTPQFGTSSVAPPGLPTVDIPGGPPVSYSEAVGEEWAIQSIVLPDGTYWGFVYDSMGSWPGTNAATASVAYGDLKELYLPSGGWIDYSYTTEQPCSGIATMPNVPQSYNRFLASRTVHDNNGNASPWSYQYSHGTYNASNLTAMAFTTIVTDPLGNDTVHTFQNQALPALQNELNAGYYPSFCSLYETTKVEYQGSHSSGTALRTTQTQYQMALDPSDTGPADEILAVTNVLPQTVTVTNAGGTTTTTSYTYPPLFVDPGDPVNRPYGDPPGTPSGPSQMSFNEPSQVSVVGSDGAAVVKTTTYQFQNNAAYHATTAGAPMANLLALPASISVGASSSNAASVTLYDYDETGSPQGSYGNLTSVHRLILGSQYAVTKAVYNTTAMPTSTTDPKGYQTSITYDGTGIFPSEIQHPQTNGIAHNDWFTTDPITGANLSHTDQNGSGPGDPAHTTKKSYDSSGRLTSVNTPDGGSTTYCYNIGSSTCSGAPANSVVKTTALSGTSNVISTTVYDGLVKTIHSQTNSDPAGAVYVDTTYDGLGRTQSVSNPYRSTEDATYGVTAFSYDALNRKTIQTEPGGPTMQWCYNGMPHSGQTNCASNLSAKSAENWVDYSDENGNHRQLVSDSLGRTIAVLEPNGTSTAPSMETDYAYDTLNDLLSVTQWGGASGASGARVRSFNYDSLSRLLCASNPENSTAACPSAANSSNTPGAVSYSYDANSNVVSKTDARGITTSYSYDALNRLLSKSYSDGATLASCYQYDSAINGNGSLGSEWTQAGNCLSTPPASGTYQSLRTFGEYDVMGRVTSEQQCVLGYCTSPSVPAQPTAHCATLSSATGLQYCYDLGGNLLAYSNGLTTEAAGQYPQQALMFAQTVDAAGRLNSLTSSWVDPTHPQSLFSAPVYTPFNALSSWLLGTQLTTNRTYDDRLRVTGQSSAK